MLMWHSFLGFLDSVLVFDYGDLVVLFSVWVLVVVWAGCGGFAGFCEFPVV